MVNLKNDLLTVLYFHCFKLLVIDCGFVKLKWFNPDSYTDSLVIVPVSRAAAQQRAGRAGRIRAGKVYRLYTEEDYENLPEQTPPEMRRTDLSSTVLHLKALGIDNVLRFHFPSPPPAKNLLAALETLYALGKYIFVEFNFLLTKTKYYYFFLP